MTNLRTIGGIFSYQQTLPVELLEVMDFDNKRTSNYWYQIIKAGLNSKIDYTREFNQDAYVNTIILKQRMSESKQKVEHFIDGDEQADRQRGVNINSILIVDDNYERLEMTDEILSALKDVRMMQKSLMYLEGINLKYIIENALEGMEIAIEKLKEICTNYELLGERIQTLLAAGVNFSTVL